MSCPYIIRIALAGLPPEADQIPNPNSIICILQFTIYNFFIDLTLWEEMFKRIPAPIRLTIKELPP